jgi:hypothetical protein
MRKKISGMRQLAWLCLIVWALPVGAAPRTWDFAGTPADRKVLAGYRLDKARIERFVAVSEMCEATGKTNPALAKEVDSFAPANVTNKTIAQQIESFPDAFPRMAAEIQKQKYSARDLILTSISVATAQLAFVGGEAPLDQLPDWIPAENVRALKDNAALLKPFLARRTRARD